MTRLMLAIVVTLAAPLAAQDAVFKDGVKQFIQQGDRVKDVKATLTISAEAVTVTRGTDVTVISFNAITGATHDRRKRPMSLKWHKSRVQHFLTIRYRGDFVELELGDSIASRVVATLEARSGQTVEKIGG